MKRQLHLSLFIHSRGHHEASWRHPGSSPLALTDIRYYQDLACRAEAALFDSVFLADQKWGASGCRAGLEGTTFPTCPWIAHWCPRTFLNQARWKPHAAGPK